MERRSGGFEVERNKAQRRGRLTVKERIQETVAALPDNVTVEQSIERLYFLAKVERGIEEADAGKLVPHDEAKRRLLR